MPDTCLGWKMSSRKPRGKPCAGKAPRRAGRISTERASAVGQELSPRKPPSRVGVPREPDAGRTISFRYARPSDALFLYDLRNESAVRKSALSTGVFSLSEHRAWLRGKLASRNCTMFIATIGSKRVGQIRFDIDTAGVADMDAALTVKSRGRGCGIVLFRDACKKLFSESRVRACRARVKIQNQASRRALESAGFREVGVRRVKGHVVCEMQLHRLRKREAR
jgi:RimJ/RimL family protein N-acetyltransferase